MSSSSATPPADPPRGLRAGWHRHLAELPRDGRDTLFQLAAVLLTLLPLSVQLPAWVSVGVLALLAWRAVLAWRGAALPPRWALLATLGVTIALTLWQFHTLLGREAGVTLIAVLLALKSLETRSRRDAQVLFFLGFFAIAANFLFSQTIAVAAAMVLATWAMLAALVNAHLPAGRPPLRQSLWTALRMMALGTPAMIALFLVFPRVSAPLWSMPDPDRSAISGLSDSMSPGTIAELARDDSVAFRVVFDGPRPPDRLLYWRGPVLSRFADGVWKPAPRLRDRRPSAMPGGLRPESAPVRYTVTLQPTQQPYLFALDAPTQAPTLPGRTVHWLPDLDLVASRAITQLVRYQAESSLSYRYGPAQMNAALRADTAWPAGDDPRTVALGKRLATEAVAAGRGGGYVAEALLRMFRNEPFHYTLRPGTYGERDGVDQFLFDRRSGFCEHYAQAFVVVMRAAGIPARIVTGYQGGSPNPLDGTWVVRQSDAHAWAEYWLPGRGWVRADPTAAVDPARVDRSGATLAAREPLLGMAALGNRDLALLRQLRNGWDALNNTWNQLVLDYGSQRQQRLFERLGLGQPDMATLMLLAIAALLIATAAAGLLLSVERARRDPWLTAYGLLRGRLARAGVPSTAGTAPRSLAQAAREAARAESADLSPASAEEAARLLFALEAWRYAPQGAGNGNAAQRRAVLRAARAWRPAARRR